MVTVIGASLSEPHTYCTAVQNPLDISYLLDQMPRLLFISSRNFVWLLFESGYYSRAAFIKLSGIGKIFCKCKCFKFYNINKELRCGDLVLKQNFQLLDQPSLSYKAVPTWHLQFIRRARAVDTQQYYSNISRG